MELNGNKRKGKEGDGLVEKGAEREAEEGGREAADGLVELVAKRKGGEVGREGVDSLVELGSKREME